MEDGFQKALRAIERHQKRRVEIEHVVDEFLAKVHPDMTRDDKRPFYYFAEQVVLGLDGPPEED